MIEPNEIAPIMEELPVQITTDQQEASRSIAKAAGILALGNVASRILGLVREIVKSNLFGASDLLGAYTVAALVPLTLFNLITGGEMVSSSLVPVFSDYAAKERRDELWGVVSTFLSLATVVLLLIVLFVEMFTPQVAWLAGARNFEDPSLVPITIELMRLATPGVLFLSIASILTGVLYALKRFVLPAFTAAIFNGMIVIVALLRPDRIDSLAWGLLLGSVLQIILQLPALRDGRFRLQFNWKHPAVRRILILYAPIVAGLVVNQAAVWISYNLAITTGDNSVTYMNYATTLYQFPLGLVVTALSIATLPTLSQLATAFRLAQDSDEETAVSKLYQFKETLAGGLRLNVTLILPAAAGLFALAGPIIALLFEHGQFTAGDTEITARVLQVYLVGLPFAAVDQMLVFASYARKDTWRPAIVGVVSIIIYTVTAVSLLNPLGLLSLMVADAVKHIVHTLIMLWLLRRHLGGLAGQGIMTATMKSLLAAFVTGLAAFGMLELISPFLSGPTFIIKLALVALAGAAGIAAYTMMVFLLQITETKSVPRLLFKRKNSVND